MKVAYFSPLTPQKSGISDYSEELLVELSKMVEIDLFISDYIPDSEYLRANFNIYPITEFNENLYKSYDEVIYHIGNNTQFHKEI
ncbi:hypothetical protein OH407_23865, partial [Salmonella enterica]|uniref:hypothetical protein n=1 Tax=Salmonella enterica TaxID=28901 RepID=UPI0022B65567